MGLFDKPDKLNPGDVAYTPNQTEFMGQLADRANQTPDQLGAQTRAGIDESAAALQEPGSQQANRLSSLGLNTPEHISQAIAQRTQQRTENDVRNLQKNQDIKNRMMGSGQAGLATHAYSQQHENDMQNYNRQMKDYTNAMQMRAQAISGILGGITKFGMMAATSGASSGPSAAPAAKPDYAQPGYDWNQSMPERGF